MNTFANNMTREIGKTRTENGANTFSTSLNCNVDFFGMASSMRHRADDALHLFQKAFHEDKLLALRNLFYLRDIRGGQGERMIFRECFNWLIHSGGILRKDRDLLFSLVPEYGRWDDLLDIARRTPSPEIFHRICELVVEQLVHDTNNMNEGKSVSLLAKWYPLENNKKNKEQKKFAVYLRKACFNSAEECRKTIVALRKYLNVVEQKMSANEWNEIKYPEVPSKANLKYSSAFKKHDGERYSEFINSVLKGTEKMNSGTLYPYEIVRKAASELVQSDQDSVDAMWKSLPDFTKGNSAICVVDVSGSMGSFFSDVVCPIDVAVSLGIYFAERNSGAFKNMFMTFSANPAVVKIDPAMSLRDKVLGMANADWGMNTNIEAVFKLYIDLAKKSKPEDCPKSIIIISDMEFDESTCDKSSKSLFEKMKMLFASEGINMPSLVFWNVNSRQNNVPVRYDESGTILVSGKSPSIFGMVMEGKTPLEFMLSLLNSDRYLPVTLSK